MKKRLLGLALSLVMVLTLLPLTAPAATALSGDGTEGNPYLITSKEDLAEFENTASGAPSGTFYKLTADIDISDSEWEPISAFSGTLLGDGHKITLTINKQTEQYAVGFVKDLYGKIKDLTIAGTVHGGEYYVGAFAGRIQSGSEITRCTNMASVNGTQTVGGIVGYSETGGPTLSGNVNKGEITGQYCVGGIVGHGSGNLRVIGCVNYGKVTGDSYVGGIVGLDCYALQGCFNSGEVIGDSYCDKIIGRSSTRPKNNYFLSSDPNETANGGAISRSEGQLASGQACWEMYSASPSEARWGQELGVDPYPVPGKADTYPVYRLQFYSSTSDYTPLEDETQYLNPNNKITRPVSTPSADNKKFKFWSLSDYGEFPPEFTKWDEGLTLEEVNDNDNHYYHDFSLYAVYEAQFQADEDDDQVTLTYGETSTIDLNKYVKFTDGEYTDDFSFSPASELPAGIEFDGKSNVTITNETNADTYTLIFDVTDTMGPVFQTVSLEPEGAYGSATLTLTVTVDKADSSVTSDPTAKALTYNGAAQELVEAGEATGGDVVYSLDEIGEYTTTIPTGTNADTYTVWYKVKGGKNHNDTEPASVNVTIGKADPTASVTAKDLTYTGEPQGLVEGKTTGGTLQYSLEQEGEYSATVPTETDADTYTVWYKVEGDENYNSIDTPKSVTVTINKAASSGAVTARALTYTGKPQKLVTPGEVTGGTLQYSLEQDGAYSEAIPTGTKVGTYTVWYKVVGNANHTDSEPQSVTVTIEDSEPPTPVEPTVYDVTVARSNHGTVSTSQRNAFPWLSVTLTVRPDEGWTLDTLTVTQDRDGKNVEITDRGNGIYSFRMPLGSVTVKATFTCLRGETCPMAPYRDADRQAWYHDGVHYCVEHGLMIGTAEDTFDPNGITTRAHLVRVLYNLEGQPTVDFLMTYKDVPQGTWYTEAVRWATSEGIVAGYGENFGPDDPVTREQIAVILYRYAGYKGRDVSSEADLTGFVDANTVSGWAVTGMRWAVGEGLIAGIGQKTLAPTGCSTRAMVAAVLERYCEN